MRNHIIKSSILKFIHTQKTRLTNLKLEKNPIERGMNFFGSVKK